MYRERQMFAWRQQNSGPEVLNLRFPFANPNPNCEFKTDGLKTDISTLLQEYKL